MKLKGTSSVTYSLIFIVLIGFLLIPIVLILKNNVSKSTNNPNISNIEDENLLDSLKDGQEIKLQVKGIEESVLKLEVAESTKAQATGLMNRTELDANNGMIFIFKNEASRTFWMKNTLISLDIIFLDENLRIINIAENTEVNQTATVYSSATKAKYVVEVNAGWTKDMGIGSGDSFEVIHNE